MKGLIMINSNSTGPRTEAGKQTSSRNAVKHGCCSTETLILPSENADDFKALEAIWFQSYSPKDDLEAHLLNQLIQADWFLQRATRTLAGVEAQVFSEVPEPINFRYHHDALQRFMRYQTTRRNEFTKAKKALADHRKIQATEKRAEEKQEIAQAKLAIYKDKNKPKPTLEEMLADMTRQAEDMGLKPKADPTQK